MYSPSDEIAALIREPLGPALYDQEFEVKIGINGMNYPLAMISETKT